MNAVKTVAVLGGCALAVLGLGARAGGCGYQDPSPASDVTGNYDVTYDDTLTIRLNIGGAVYEETTTGESGVVVFDTIEVGPITLDLGAFCARPEVQCPSETFWSAVSVAQPYNSGPNANSHVINVIDDTDPNPPAGVMAAVAPGLLDENDGFLLALGAGATGVGTNCALLAVSLAGGRFTHAGETAPGTFPPGAAVDGVADGVLGIGYLGACAFSGLVVGATLTLETGYTAVRTGAFDPPPFTPVDPGTVEPGLCADAGAVCDGADGGASTDAGAGTDAGIGTDAG